jgi:type I restriction enzyme R subunit
LWEQLAVEAEQAKVELEKRLIEQQTTAATQPKEFIARFVNAAGVAASAVQLDEADTRKLIDEQLRQAGWLADSASLTYG